jgi:hypothetical protein
MGVQTPENAMSRTLKILTTIAIIGVIAAVAVTQLPTSGYDSDVTRVGQGRPAVVLVFENFAAPSMDAMALFDQVRGDYADRLDFLVADSGSPRGQTFITRHQAQVGQVLTFRGDGTLVRAEHLAGDEAALRERLRSDLGL